MSEDTERWRCCPGCSYGQHLPSSGDLATEPPLLPPQANLTPLDLGLSPSDPWPEVQHSFHFVNTWSMLLP